MCAYQTTPAVINAIKLGASEITVYGVRFLRSYGSLNLECVKYLLYD